MVAAILKMYFIGMALSVLAVFQLSFTTGAMVAAILKMYFIGTALSVLAVLYGIVDSFGGLMYVQDQHYILDLDHRTQRQVYNSNHRRGSSVTKNIGS